MLIGYRGRLTRMVFHTLKKIFYKHLIKKPIFTVQLRGRVSEKDSVFLEGGAKPCLLKNTREIKKLLKANKDKEIIFEIGFGNGSHINDLASNHSKALIIGSEMYISGVINTLRIAVKNNLKNIRVTSLDARQTLKCFENNSLDKAYILFPDPWPKARHNKRRLLKKPFIENLLSKVRRGGEIVIATDWVDYAIEIKEVLKELTSESGGFAQELEAGRQIPIKETTFAVRAQKEGREIYIIKFVKK